MRLSGSAAPDVGPPGQGMANDLVSYCPARIQELRRALDEYVSQDASGWHAEIRDGINNELLGLQITMNGGLLHPGALAVLASFERELKVLDATVTVHERKALGETDVSRLSTLVVCSDGGPNRPLKQKEVAGSVSVVIVSSASAPIKVRKMQCVPLSDVGEELNLGLKCRRSCNGNTIRFTEISADKGSKKELVWLGIQVDVSIGSEKVMLETLVDGPFVVTTNEKQWESSLRDILKHSLYGKVGTLSRFRLCNELQKVYLMGIRESNMEEPKRPLNQTDFEFILQTTVPSATGEPVTADMFVKVWDWFGAILSKVRHDRTALEMWTAGLIAGFVPKNFAEELLRRERPGSFLLRCSSQVGGAFAIAFTSPQGGAVQHYLMKKADLNASNSLAKFLLEKAFFATLIQVVPNGVGPVRWNRMNKDDALATWAPKVKDNPTVDGYEENLSVAHLGSPDGGTPRTEVEAEKMSVSAGE